MIAAQGSSKTECFRPTRRRATLWLAASLVASAFPALATEPPRAAEPPVKVEIRAKPIASFDTRDPQRVRFGALEFRGGIELSSDYQNFGGLSGLYIAPDGMRFLALSDRGRWLRGRIIAEGDKPVRIEDAEMAPILGLDGRPLGARGWYDTESLAMDGGTAYVAIERVNQIVRFDYGRQGLLARGQPIPIPAGVRELPRSKGLEALTFVPRGLPLASTLIAISERGLDAAGNIRGFLIGGPSPGDFTVLRSDDFEITDTALTPAGDFLILERKFSIFRGAGMRIRKIALADIKPGAVLDGPVLILADRANQIDNMEALGVHRNAAGETILTIISDDNFNPLQRTILLRFALIQ
ncbi:MAG TPA: esterase-like activity of phytase family protein [Xanthobacteraceae bacterium]